MTGQQVESRLRPPAEVVEIAQTLRAAGHETWCVGGAVRDALAGEESLDWDLATAATPQVVRRLFRRTIPVGIEFGTVGVLDGRGVMHEVTTFRRDVHTDGRHAVVEFGASLDDDLARRDFTINAIAFDPIGRHVHDPFGGRADLEAGVVRAVGNAEARLEEDRLRALRAIRFSARFGFRIDPETWAAIVGSAPFMSRLSPERVKQELEKTMEQTRTPSVAFAMWRDSGIFATLIPAVAGVSDETLRAIDVLPAPVLAGRPQRRALRVAALFSELDARAAESALRSLRFSNQEIAWISGLVGLWASEQGALSALVATGAEMDNANLRRLAARVGRLRVGPLLRLAAAHWAVLPAERAPSARRVRALYRRALRIAFRDAIAVADLAVDGDDLRSLGISPGPAFARILQALLQQVVEEPSLNSREELLARASQLAASSREG